VAFVVLLNGVAAIALLVALAHGTSTGGNIKPFADAMMVFGAGAALGLTSAFVAYLGRTFRLERPALTSWRRPLRWLAVAAAIAGTACFLGGLNMARIAMLPKEAASPPSAARSSAGHHVAKARAVTDHSKRRPRSSGGTGAGAAVREEEFYAEQALFLLRIDKPEKRHERDP
jgi:hypothetical protein